MKKRRKMRRFLSEFVYFFCSTILICTSSSCFCSTGEGAFISKSRALAFMGKAMTSRMLTVSEMSMTMRSTPGATPAWGGAPYSKA